MVIDIKKDTALMSIYGIAGLIIGTASSAYYMAPQEPRRCKVYTVSSAPDIDLSWTPRDTLLGVSAWPEMTRLIVPYSPEGETEKDLEKSPKIEDRTDKPEKIEIKHPKKKTRHHRRRRHW